jgi:ribosomal-protein-alanine N-acetyltransferase
MDDIVIMPMAIDHIPQVVDIERKAFTTPWRSEVFLHELHEIEVSRSFVALDGERVVGYMIAWFIEDEIHLINIAVANEEQRKGIGSILLLHLIERAFEEGRKLVTLEVRVSNVAAVALYRSFSFEYVGVRERYYSDNKEDAILMILDVEAYRQRMLKKNWEG